MTVISSKEFAINQKKFYNMALNERVFIRRGRNMFSLAHTVVEDDDEALDLADAIAAGDDENVDVDDYLKSIYERNLAFYANMSQKNIIYHGGNPS